MAVAMAGMAKAASEATKVLLETMAKHRKMQQEAKETMVDSYQKSGKTMQGQANMSVQAFLNSLKQRGQSAQYFA